MFLVEGFVEELRKGASTTTSCFTILSTGIDSGRSDDETRSILIFSTAVYFGGSVEESKNALTRQGNRQ